MTLATTPESVPTDAQSPAQKRADELEQGIALLKMLRQRICSLVELTQAYDMRLAGEFQTMRAHVEQRLANLLLERELQP